MRVAVWGGERRETGMLREVKRQVQGFFKNSRRLVIVVWSADLAAHQHSQQSELQLRL